MSDPVHPRTGSSKTPMDDLARVLPDPPPPRPAPRSQAISSALDRFDGVGTARPVRMPTPAPPALGWWSTGRAQLTALASAVLVALFAIPLALQHPDGSPKLPSKPASSAGDKLSVVGSMPQAPAQGDRPPAAELAAVDDTSPTTPAARSAPSDRAPTAPPAEPEQLAADTSPAAVVPAPAAPAPPPPPAMVAPQALADASDTAQRASSAEDDTSSIVVTGSRISRGAKAASRRGDWNACTLVDPEQSLRGCNGLIRTGAKGAAGAAGAQVAEGLALGWRGDFGSAVAAFDRAIGLQPRLGIAHLNRGLARERLGASDEALADFDQAVRLDPSARSYYARSRARRASGDVKGARADADRAIELDNDYARVLQN